VERFATTPERTSVLEGLLNYRAELHKSGITTGFQWLDGSFIEHIELLEARPPKDVDVVTFFRLPSGMDENTFAQNNRDLFLPAKTKVRYRVDAYPFLLQDKMNERHVKQISYWYSMWAHRRTGLWKGFLQVDLSSSEDSPARDALDLIKGAQYELRGICFPGI
jgi:hypothetical protein